MYLFLIALETIFATTKNNPNIKVLNIFNHNHLHTTYANDATFLNEQKSISELMKTFELFSTFFDLEANILNVRLQAQVL